MDSGQLVPVKFWGACAGGEYKFAKPVGKCIPQYILHNSPKSAPM